LELAGFLVLEGRLRSDLVFEFNEVLPTHDQALLHARHVIGLKINKIRGGSCSPGLRGSVDHSSRK